MLQARILGQFDLRLDGQPVEFTSRPAQSLFTYLLLNPGKPQRREKLAGLLWPEASESNARSNLRSALWRIRKALETAGASGREYLRADDQSLILSLQPGDWLDVSILDAKVSAETSTDGLIEMVAVYAGELLPGFYEDWVLLERERLQAAFERKMGMLLERLLAEGRWDETLEWGERWIAQGSIPEPAYRALMQAHAALGDLARAAETYQRCVEALRRELGVEPSEQTRQVFARIQAGKVETREAQSRPTLASPILPAFLIDEAEKPEPVFVGREEELAVLDQYLAKALAGHGQVAFVRGEAGSGKSSLLQAFMRRSVAAHPDLVAAVGICNAFFGQGDPYLPFRDVMGMLSGEVEAQWASGSISREHARRLWGMLPLAVQSLVEQGPGLLNTFVPTPSLLTRTAAAMPGGNGWRERIEKIAAMEPHVARGQAQSQLFEQYTQVLRSMASQHLLLILLDDLQWMDSGSGNLLFHLGRRLQGAPILILGAYRGEEVALGREGERHPLEPLLHEFQRAYGEITIDLDQVRESSGREFVDALLESQPNRLDEGFHRELYQHTQGQPLFTVQLLRDLQERGELAQDEQGYWVRSPNLDWSVMPAQVEGVITERVARLDSSLRELLSIASVEGEEFSLQVLEQVQGIPGRALLRSLSQDLEKRHRLVRERGELKAGEQTLSRFQFSHALIQQYLYSQLGRSERKLLHREVAGALEDLYAGKTGEIAVQLARHYHQAGVKEKAVEYLLLAGDQARGMYAHQEASAHYQQALAYLKEMDETERAARTLMKLNLVYHSAFDFQRAQDALDEGNALWQRARVGVRLSLPPAARPYRLPYGDMLPVIDPGRASQSGVFRLTKQLFCGLVEWTPDLNVVPMAAQSWEVQEQGRRYVFQLRQDMRWSDGEPVTAQDFEFAWKRALDPATQSVLASVLYDLRGAREFHQGQVADPGRVGVAAPDAYTLVVELQEPAGYFPYILGCPITFAVPKHVVEREGEAWTDPGKIVTNGAFQIDSWRPGQTARFSRSPLYPGRFTGNIERVELIFYPDVASAYAAFTTGEGDRIGFNFPTIPSTDLDHYRETGQLSVRPMPAGLSIYFVADQPPFDDPRLRRAFALAIDREKLSEEALAGYALPAMGGYVPPGLPGHSPHIGLPYDPQEAQRLLAAAGFPNGRGFPQVTLSVGIEAETSLVLAFLRDMWAQNLGIAVQEEWRRISIAYYAAPEGQKPHFFLSNWEADYPDPDSFLRANFLLEKMRWQNAAFEALIEEGRHSLDQGRRLELYRQADRVLIEETVIAPLTYYLQTVLLAPWVHEPAGSTLYSPLWKDIMLEPHEGKEERGGDEPASAR